MKRKLFLLIIFALLLAACSNEKLEKMLFKEAFSKNESVTFVYYYKDKVCVDFDTNENIYTLSGKNQKYYYCNEDSSYEHFSKSGTFNAVVTLEAGAKSRISSYSFNKR